MPAGVGDGIAAKVSGIDPGAVGDLETGLGWLSVSIVNGAFYNTGAVGGLEAPLEAVGWTGTAPTWGEGVSSGEAKVTAFFSFLCDPNTAGSRV